MLMWAMSDRAIPRSYRTMQGFGVHTFRLVNAAGESHFVKFHWTPLAGTHSLVWDEAVKISGADPDFHRRDLWEAIEAGAYPEYELGLQIFTEEQAEGFTFDVLDATKIVPEELVPVVPVGKLVLNRNPDNFFAETEQVAFCTAHVVPGIDFTNDPLLAGRIHSYVDTQISRLGGPNFHEIPINAPVAQVHNNQRDGMHRQAINRGRVVVRAELARRRLPVPGGRRGFRVVPGAAEAGAITRCAARPSGSPTTTRRPRCSGTARREVEKTAHHQRLPLRAVARADAGDPRTHGVGADERRAELAAAVAAGLGIRELPAPMPKALTRGRHARRSRSRRRCRSSRVRATAVSARGGSPSWSPTVSTARPLDALVERLTAEGAVPRFVGPRLGRGHQRRGGDAVEVDLPLPAASPVLFDAMILAGGADAVQTLSGDGRALEFVKDQYRHCKAILVLGEGRALIDKAGIPATLPDGSTDTGLLFETGKSKTTADAFVEAVARHRHFARETDPPRV